MALRRAKSSLRACSISAVVELAPVRATTAMTSASCSATSVSKTSGAACQVIESKFDVIKDSAKLNAWIGFSSMWFALLLCALPWCSGVVHFELLLDLFTGRRLFGEGGQWPRKCVTILD
jgi:hypothetical protein